MHSVIRQFTVPVVVPISLFCSSIYFVKAVAAVPTLSVLVMMIGVSIVPNSSICNRMLYYAELKTLEKLTESEIK